MSHNNIVQQVLLFGKIFGLHPIKLSKDAAVFHKFWSIYTAILLFFYYVICCLRFSSSLGENQSVSGLVNYLQIFCFILSLTANILCPIFNRKNFSVVLNLLQSFNYSSKLLPLSCIIVTIVLIIFFTIFTITITISKVNLSYTLSAVISIVVNSVNVCQLFIFSSLFHEHFKYLNQYCASAYIKSHDSGKREVNYKHVNEKLKVFSQLNCELRTSVGYFSNTYSVQLLVNVGTIFLVIIVQCYYGFLISGLPTINQCLVIFWIIIHVLQLLAIVTAFELITREASRIGEILNTLLLKSFDTEIRTELSYISLQVSNQPLNFTACNFFSLDFKLLLSLGGVLTTYLIILSQFAGKNNEKVDINTFSG